ncbi:hypothetical protein [Streptomyces sp. NPDC059874]
MVLHGTLHHGSLPRGRWLVGGRVVFGLPETWCEVTAVTVNTDRYGMAAA